MEMINLSRLLNRMAPTIIRRQIGFNANPPTVNDRFHKDFVVLLRPGDMLVQSVLMPECELMNQMDCLNYTVFHFPSDGP